MWQCSLDNIALAEPEIIEVMGLSRAVLCFGSFCLKLCPCCRQLSWVVTIVSSPCALTLQCLRISAAPRQSSSHKKNTLSLTAPACVEASIAQAVIAGILLLPQAFWYSVTLDSWESQVLRMSLQLKHESPSDNFKVTACYLPPVQLCFNY